MTKERLGILIGAIAVVILLSGWMIYGAIQTSKNTYMAGAPPDEIRKALQPQNIPLEQMHPPAPRASDPVRYGSATSVASVIEYGDFECENCRELKKTFDAVLPKFKGKVRLIWRDLPVRDVNPNAFEAAMFARCAALQGKFWEANDALYAAPNLGESTYAQIASDLSLNVGTLAACRSDQTIRTALQDDVDAARNDGVNSAPFFFVGTKANQGVITPEALERQIKSFLAS